ncbi:hypothetical protein P3342_002375 [Pyrenophora teres f. teres]|uniref:MYND-type domain-containing protein n=1 Tax=Pyrenophora teres f. teres (strain 0-1) TaxID=861557 RepID=E3RVG7_PYRTT|nr:hypothetical protein PTT_13158 [Pyrenophora teres f. teres 0-1]KAE8838427.1 hypothetical protein HRS9139_02810 [Pyrenophora teres f. teres]CAA9962656.1 HIT-MYND zinc finger protein [Pyrenophora teres f. maculata]KAE8844393.1 hypothetical protein PTNB85_02658 [Pyrenophora teres f. teres]KAE8847410.1 hypothetical protein HRS9122_04317 [Pyrenophora teres f. teres]
MTEPAPTANPSSNTQADSSAASSSAPTWSSPVPNTQDEAISSSSTPVCAQCGKSPDSLKQCIKCHSVNYCNKDCQKSHFKTHKKACPILAQEYVKLHEPKMASRSSGVAKGEGRERGLQKWQFDT